MPLYSWICPECAYAHDAWMLPAALDHWQPQCGACGATMDYDFSPPFRRAPFAAFETTHITGQPIIVDSLGVLRKIEKQHNVVWPAYSGGGLLGDMPIPHTAWESGDGKVHYG